jgi:hypothetical protein
MIRAAWWACFVMCVTACAANSVSYSLVDKGVQSARRFADFTARLITAEEPFTQLFRELHANTLPPPRPPGIDFTRFFVLFMAMQEQPTAGYALEVESIARHGDVLQVRVNRQPPPPGTLQATVMTQPFVILQVQRTKGLKRVEISDQEAKVLGTLPVAD